MNKFEEIIKNPHIVPNFWQKNFGNKLNSSWRGHTSKQRQIITTNKSMICKDQYSSYIRDKNGKNHNGIERLSLNKLETSAANTKLMRNLRKQENYVHAYKHLLPTINNQDRYFDDKAKISVMVALQYYRHPDVLRFYRDTIKFHNPLFTESECFLQAWLEILDHAQRLGQYIANMKFTYCNIPNHIFLPIVDKPIFWKIENINNFYNDFFSSRISIRNKNIPILNHEAFMPYLDKLIFPLGSHLYVICSWEQDEPDEIIYDYNDFKYLNDLLFSNSNEYFYSEQSNKHILYNQSNPFIQYTVQGYTRRDTAIFFNKNIIKTKHKTKKTLYLYEGIIQRII